MKLILNISTDFDTYGHGTTEDDIYRINAAIVAELEADGYDVVCRTTDDAPSIIDDDGFNHGEILSDVWGRVMRAGWAA